MPTVTFEGATHPEIVAQVRTWLASTEAELEGTEAVANMVNETADLTKEALRVIAEVAPESIAQSELVASLTELGLASTDVTRDVALSGVDLVEQVTGGSIVRNVAERGSKAVWQMSAPVAKQILRAARDT